MTMGDVMDPPVECVATGVEAFPTCSERIGGTAFGIIKAGFVIDA